jgi:hypothetical protein
MPTYVLSYRQPKGFVPGQPEMVAAWKAWFDSMGENLADRGNPVFESTALGECGESTKLGGYSFLTADDFESAVAIAKGAPLIEAGGGVEVGVVTFLNPDSASDAGS